MTTRDRADETARTRDRDLRHAQKMEAVGQLAGGIAHEFNNLLTAILGYADLLADQLPVADPAREKVLEIQKAGRAAASLTRDLLIFSRRQTLQPVSLDLNALVVTTERLLGRLLGEGIEIRLDLDPAPRPIQADPGQITQVLLNLALNARDAMPGGGRLTISTSRRRGRTSPGGRPGAGEVLLTMRDTGRGMADDVRTRVFEPFFTTKDVGQGTGLGLATVYGIVVQSGGRIWVDSAPGEGTTFLVAFPATAARSALTPA